MRFTQIDRTDLRVTRVSFGTGSLHHAFRQRDRIALLRSALDAGITHFDTSPVYGYGLAEKDIGAAFSGRRDQVTITTKVGLYPPPGFATASNVWLRKAIGKISSRFNSLSVSWSIRRAEASLTRSLKRLRTNFVDLLLLHEPSWDASKTSELQAWLERQHRSGRIRNWGLGGVREALEPWVIERHPLANVVQTKDSIADREAEFVVEADRPLQFTYGYMGHFGPAQSINDTMAQILRRNPTGSVIFSTRRLSRLKELAKAVIQ